MYVPEQINYYQQQKQALIDKNYWSVYKSLLHNDGYLDNTTGKYMASCKEPFYIGNKDVYALSDIEGNNFKFLSFLKTLGLVEIISLDQTAGIPYGWKRCHANDNPNGKYVYYRFNKEKC